MKMWIRIIISVAVAILAWAAYRVHMNTMAKQRRETTYQASLRSFTQAVRQGLPRGHIEAYLKAKGHPFIQMCCVSDRSALADLVKIGEESAPWYCSEQWVHIAFDFAATQPHDSLKPLGSDVLKSVTIFRQFGGCL
jgi:hypothetical protein